MTSAVSETVHLTVLFDFIIYIYLIYNQVFTYMKQTGSVNLMTSMHIYSCTISVKAFKNHMSKHV